MFLTLIKTLLTLYGGLSPIELYPSDYGPNLQNGDVFDFIVIGAGSAGSVIASRLSEVTQWNVLVIEAGGYPSDMSEIPSLSLSLQETDEDWQYVTEPSQTCCLGMKRQRCPCARGKGLGGSSLINFLAYTRATRYDHEFWGDGWDYDSVLPYYNKVENAHTDDTLYGRNGELHLTKYTTTQPLRVALANAYQELGYGEYSEQYPLGYRDLLQTVHQGTRQNSAKAYLTKAKNRPNLFMALHTQVACVLVERGTAYGVVAKINERTVTLRASKEVILSAGSFNSPQILMSSGIGPKRHLEDIGVTVLKDLSVGENYQDHAALPLIAIKIDPAALHQITPLQLISEFYNFFAHRTGEFTQMGLLNFAGYVGVKNESTDVQIFQTVFPQADEYLLPELLRIIGVSESFAESLINVSKETPLLGFLPVLLHPKSTGRVMLRSADPFAHPLIIPNYFSEDGDVDTLVKSVRLIKRLIETDAFSAYNATFIKYDVENCVGYAQDSDTFWECAVRNIAYPIYHPVGTCKMGGESDPDAVVDPELKVIGIERLRVVDASVIPVAPSSNTNAPTLMIGEKGADLVKNAWLKRHDEL